MNTNVNIISVIASTIAQGVVKPTIDDTIIAYLSLVRACDSKNGI